MLRCAEQQELMNRVVALKTGIEAKLCSSDYCLIHDFWVVKMNDEEYLAKIDKKGDKDTLDDLLQYVPVEDIYRHSWRCILRLDMVAATTCCSHESMFCNYHHFPGILIIS